MFGSSFQALYCTKPLKTIVNISICFCFFHNISLLVSCSSTNLALAPNLLSNHTVKFNDCQVGNYVHFIWHNNVFQIAVQTYDKIAKFKKAGSMEGDYATHTNFLPIDSFNM